MKTRAIALGIAVGLVSAMGVLTLSQGTAQARTQVYVAPTEASPEVARIVALELKDAKRARKEMLALYRQDGLRSGADYRAAAKMLEGSKDREDLLMSHDFALAALALGDDESKSIVARTEDQLFRSVGLGERFGTIKGGNVPLTPSHRSLMDVNEAPGVRRCAPAPTAV